MSAPRGGVWAAGLLQFSGRRQPGDGCIVNERGCDDIKPLWEVCCYAKDSSPTGDRCAVCDHALGIASWACGRPGVCAAAHRRWPRRSSRTGEPAARPAHRGAPAARSYGGSARPGAGTTCGQRPVWTTAACGRNERSCAAECRAVAAAECRAAAATPSQCCRAGPFGASPRLAELPGTRTAALTFAADARSPVG